MTFTETADAMRRLADAMDVVVATRGRNPQTGRPVPLLEDDYAIGAAAFLCYLRDLITVGERDIYDRGAILVLPETCSRDSEIFPCGVASMMWDVDEEREIG